ncbi:MAG: FtsX-like permease family protein [Oscillospiraceae bacterium]|nr:FtsX-like permease family protein [Oscillospiraceae bacterium]
MVGLMSSAPTMRMSVDKYFDDTNFMDIQLYSSYGFDDRDIEALEKAENVDELFATKFADVFLKNNTGTVVTRVQELDSNINRYELIEGRMPQKTNEALALGSSSFGAYFKVGDKAEVYLEDEDLSKTLSCTEYDIVGIVKTPQYMASSREVSTLNNLNLSTVIFIDNSNFLNDYYTSVYLTFKDSKALSCFDDEYTDFIEENIDILRDVTDKQENVRKQEIIKEITEEIENGEKELEEKIADAQKEIDDGRKKLEDANIQILVGEAQLESSEKQMSAGEEEIARNKELLQDAERQIDDAKKQIAEQSGMSYEEAAASIKAAYGVYTMVDSALGNPEGTPEEAIDNEIAAKNSEIDKLQKENNALKTENNKLEKRNTVLTAEIKALEKEIENLKNTPESDSNENSDSESNENSDSESSGNENSDSSDNSDNESSDSSENSDSSSDSYADSVFNGNAAAIKEKEIELAAKKAELEANKQKINSNKAAIEENEEKINTLRAEIVELQGIKSVLNDENLQEIQSLIDNMFNGDVTAAYNGILQLEAAQTEIEYGKRQLAAAKAELEAGRIQIEEAKKQLEDGKKEYKDGLSELEDAQQELDKEYEKARIDLDKAKQELADLPEAEWMILDREEHYSSAMYKNNADQMKRIGNVFPMLFCLVAALVCMTTMKRLVDEQRSQIGVFSALGFSKGKIISKYVLYALSASLLGSSIGIPIGVLSLPWVIYFCWQMMYDLPPMVLTMPAYIAVIGVGLFTLLMVWVTFTVVRGTLKECPSQLMRPKAPRTAKKVFLENIPFIWKRLSFTSKVTSRNIIRYKSRFFMTVIGVAGCTSLLVLGFAIKGSIGQVITRQYGDILHYDLTVTMEDSDYLDSIYEQLLDDRNVEYAVPFMTYSAMAKSDDEEKAIQVYVMDDRDIYDVIALRDKKTKERLSVRDGAVISEKYAKLCNIKVGDTIEVESSNGIKKDIEVSGICEMYTQHYMFIGDKYYEDIFGETVYCNNIAVDCINSSELMAKFEDTKGIKTIADFADTIATFSSMLDTLDIIVVVIIVAAGSLALVVIMNLTEVNISERIREIATLKVLGFNNKEVYSYIFKEVFILSLIGMVLGLPLGKLELIFVMDIIEMEMVMFSTVIEPLTYLYGFCIIMLFTIMVIMLMRKTLRNVEMVESLKSVE